MNDEFGGPKFPGELSDHLPRQSPSEGPDRWIDRIRHAWFAYFILAAGVALWGAVTAIACWNFGLKGLMGTVGGGCLLLLSFYIWTLQLRLYTGRDPNTGERIGPEKRR